MNGHMADCMAELAALLAFTELKEGAERLWNIQSGALETIRLLERAMRVQERLSPDGSVHW